MQAGHLRGDLRTCVSEGEGRAAIGDVHAPMGVSTRWRVINEEGIEPFAFISPSPY